MKCPFVLFEKAFLKTAFLANIVVIFSWPRPTSQQIAVELDVENYDV